MFLETLGGRGQGPGEFEGLGDAWPRGDTIEVYDRRLIRLTRFLPGGSTEVVPFRLEASARIVEGALPDGWLMIQVSGSADARDRIRFIRVDRSGAWLGQVAEVAGSERFATPDFSGSDPLSPEARFAVSNGRIYLGETFTPAVSVLLSDGTVERELSWIPADTLSPAAAFRAIVDSAAARQPLLQGSMRERLEAFSVRDRVPWYWDLLVDQRAFVWIQPFEPGRHSVALGLVSGGPRSDGEWWTLSPDGVKGPSVRIPTGLRPTQVTEDAIVGVVRDELGVEFIHAYRVHRH